MKTIPHLLYRGTAVVAEWYRYRIVAGLVTSSSPVSRKTHRVGQRCTLNLSRAETRPPIGVVDMRGGASSGFVHVTWPMFKITWSVTKSSRVAEQCDVNIHSLTHFVSRKITQGSRIAFLKNSDFGASQSTSFKILEM
ncbi:uncharacterized protein TNCV_1143791 [Trichonephila clavipes]|nr:uncharacterized protein TNCV_1143791 [Trichonephila clavipes]